jgi:hypothetical protein
MTETHTPTATPAIEKFEHLLDLESAARGARATVECQGAGVPLFRKQQMHEAMKRAQKTLFAALDALSVEEQAAYGAYRAQVLAEIAQRKS